MRKKVLSFVLIFALLLVSACGLAACADDTQKVKYTVTFEANGGSAVNAVTVNEGEAVTLPDTAKSGYTFEGWFESSAFTGSRVPTQYTPAASITLYAKFTPAAAQTTFTVTFEVNGGSVVNAVTVNEGAAVTLPDTAKDGYTFEGWYESSAFSGSRVPTQYTPAASITLYAKFTPAAAQTKFTVTFEVNGGSAVNSVTVNEGEAVTLPDTAKDGYTFEGWYESSAFSGSRVPTQYTPAASITLYAKFTPAAAQTTFTVTFEANGGSAVNAVTVNEGEAVTLPDTAKNGYTFEGWFESSAFSGERVPTQYTPAASITLYAKFTPVETILYKLNDDNASYTVKQLKDTTVAELEIPSTYKSLPVTKIESFAFADCRSLTAVTVPDSVTEIGSDAFKGCYNLAELDLPFAGKSRTATAHSAVLGYIFGYTTSSTQVPPSGTTYQYYGGVYYHYYIPASLRTVTVRGGVIASNAFMNCGGLTSLKFCDDVTEFGIDALKNCNNLIDITLPFTGKSRTAATYEAVLGYIFGYDARTAVTTHVTLTFQYYDSTQYYSYYHYYIPATLRTVTVTGGAIGDYAFRNCKNLIDVTLGAAVTAIGGYAFNDCVGLTSLTVPESVQTMGAAVFKGCSGLTQVSLEAVSCTAAGSIEFPIFDDCANLKTFLIGDGVTKIPDFYFNGFDGLTALTIPSSVTAIGNSAFQGCVNLIALSIPSSVKTIGNSAFEACVGLETVLPASGLTSIGNSAFSGCISLYGITFSTSVKALGDSAFLGCIWLTNVTLPESITSLGKSVFKNCTDIIRVNFFATNCERAGSSGAPIFEGCTALTQVVIGANVRTIPDYLFEQCRALESVVIPEGVTQIGKSAFRDCTALERVDFNALECALVFGGNAFEGCTALATVNIAENVTRLPSGLFNGCAALTSVTIPSSVTYIGTEVFKDCTALAVVNYNATDSYSMSDYDYPVFAGCTALATVNIGADVISIPRYLFQGCTGLIVLTIPASVTAIGYGAFQGCVGLTDIWCEAAGAPSGWAVGWNTGNSAAVHWGGTWEYVDGVPTPKID